MGGLLGFGGKRHDQTANKGGDLTPAQVAKAKRYVRLGLIRQASINHDGAGWGESSIATTTYGVEPLPNCHDALEVKVAEQYAPNGILIDVRYKCPCQFAAGKVGSSDLCSHAHAVHLFRIGK